MLLPISRQKNVSSTDLNSVNQKIDLLMTMMNDIAPVVKSLNKIYEDSLIAESDEDIDDSDIVPPTKQTKLATDTTEVPMGVVNSLVSEVNTEEKTGLAISEKIAKALDGILSVGLNESVAAKRKEAVDRPQNCKLLTTTTSGSSNQFFPRTLGLPPFLFRDRQQIHFRGNYS